MKKILPMMIGFAMMVLLLVGVMAAVWFLYLTREVATIPAAAPEASAAIEATVNGVAITPAMVEREVNVSRLSIVQPLPPLEGDDLARARAEALNQLIERQMVLQAAARQNFTIDDATVAERVRLLYGSHGDEALDQALASANATRADLTWWVRELTTVEAFTTQVIMADVPPEERQVVYNDWLNSQRATADIQRYEDGQAHGLNARVGEPAPPFTLETPQGQPISLADYQGQVVLVNFWATWCPSCVTEMPAYEQVYQQQQSGEFVVLGVNLQEEPAHVAQYADGLGVTFPVLLDSSGEVTTRQYQAVGMPASYLINRDGTIYYRHMGPMSKETLESKLAELGL